jgi:hypothetical protein
MTDGNAPQDAVVIERSFDAPADLIWRMWTDGGTIGAIPRLGVFRVHTGIPADSPGAAGWVMAFSKLAAHIEEQGLR